jgi:hypothetical protein
LFSECAESFIALLVSGGLRYRDHYVVRPVSVRGKTLEWPPQLQGASLLILGSQVGKAGREPSMGAMRPRLDRADGDAELFGDLRVRVSNEMLQTDDFAFVGFETVDGSPHSPDRFDLLGTGRQRDQSTVRRVCQLERTRWAALLTPQRVDASASSDGCQPGREVTTGFEVFGVPPCLEEHVLRDILGTLPVANHAVGNGVDQAAEPLVQGADRIVAAVTEGEREFGIALHLMWRTELFHDRRQRIRWTSTCSGHSSLPSTSHFRRKKNATARTPPLMRGSSGPNK